MPGIELMGARVAYAQSGSGETVLLLHATAGSGAQWRSLTEALGPDRCVLAPDLYGYGETDPWPGQAPFGLAEEAALAAAVLPPGGGAFHLIGHSYGGAVALRLAMQQPERLRSLVLIEPVAFHLLREDAADHESFHLLREVTELATVLSKAAANGDYCSAMAQFVDYWNGEGAWLRSRPELQAALERLAPKEALDFWATMTETTPRAAYGRIAAPALVLRGARSPRPARRIAELVAASLPFGHLQTIEGAGHMLPLTHKEAVNAAIAEHLRRALADGRRTAAA
jgi:pimeloyl-ACP methyl ester carboxylesterase